MRVAATPYAWPFDGPAAAADTMLLMVDATAAALTGAPEAAEAMQRLHAACRGRGIATVLALRDPRDRPLITDPKAILLARTASNAFIGSALMAILREQRIRNLILAGALAEGAVHATMRAANDHGFECLLVEDATASAAPDLHVAVLRITRFGHGLFGTTATLDAVLGALS